MSTLATTEEAALERALELDEVQQIVADLLPRATRIYPELKEESETKRTVGEFILAARNFEANPETYTGQNLLHPGWVGENLAPIVLRWEDILAKREHEAATSDFVGNVGQAIFTEAEVTFTKSREGEWGPKFLTILKDTKGNVLKYWNAFHVIDPILEQARIAAHGLAGATEGGKRNAVKGDILSFKATVKEHQIYKGVRGTVLQRARKVALLKCGDVSGVSV